MAKRKAKVWAPKHMCSASATMLDHPLSQEERAQIAVEENPFNMPRVPAVLKDMMAPQFIAAVTGKWWGPSKTKFTIFFMGSASNAVKDRIIKFANIWNEDSAIVFAWTNDAASADFRCSFKREGYYSYIGVDCKSIPLAQNTMNLEGMDSLSVPDRELMRVVPHECGHGMGFTHEHSRQEVINLLDRNKTIAQMQLETGWTPQQIVQQVFTVMPQSAIFGTAPDVNSIMCYFFSGKCTKSGQPIPGGNTLSALDRNFAATTWPKTSAPPPVVNPPAAGKYAALLSLPDGSQRKLVEAA